MEVGQEIYVEPIGNAARYGSEIKKDVISKIGRKYFETENHRGRFLLKTLKEDGGKYIPNYKVYLSIKDYEDEKLTKELKFKLAEYFSYNTKLSLDKLREIAKIIGV